MLDGFFSLSYIIGPLPLTVGYMWVTSSFTIERTASLLFFIFYSTVLSLIEIMTFCTLHLPLFLVLLCCCHFFLCHMQIYSDNFFCSSLPLSLAQFLQPLLAPSLPETLDDHVSWTTNSSFFMHFKSFFSVIQITIVLFLSEVANLYWAYTTSDCKCAVTYLNVSVYIKIPLRRKKSVKEEDSCLAFFLAC